MTIVYIHQPDFIPSLNFFLRAKKSDIFVILDDVLLNRNGWTNRDIIKTRHGIKKITVPIKYIERHNAIIKNVKISYEHNWIKKNLSILEENYKESKFFNSNIKLINSGLNKRFTYIIDLNIYFIKKIFKIFSIKTKIIYASELKIPSTKSQKILDICKVFNAKEYITGLGSKNYLDEDSFKKSKISLNYSIYFKKNYKQIGDNFVNGLSVIDYLFNCYDGKQAKILNE